MSRKEDLEKLILESYKVIHQNNQKILNAADPREKSRLRQDNEDNWEDVKTFLADYTSLCEVRRLMPLEEIIDIAATRFPDIVVRLEAVSKARPISPTNILTKPSLSSTIEDIPIFQISYKFVRP